MKIAMLGCGAAGSCFASYLRKGGADDIVLVDLYKAHMDKVAADGMDFTDPTGTYHLDGFKTAYTADDIGIVDIAIIMVKATQTEGLLEKSKACIGPETVVDIPSLIDGQTVTGVVLRNETPVVSKTQGVTHFLVGDGSHVSKNGVIASDQPNRA